MAEENLPNPVGEAVFPPPSLTPKQEELCTRLDLFYERHNLEVKPSDMFRGAIFAMKTELRGNPEWMSQAASSLRGILYPFGNHNSGTNLPNQDEAFRQFGSVRLASQQRQDLGRIFGDLTQLAHHGHGKGKFNYLEYTAQDFEDLVSRFENAMFDVLDRQIDIHEEIDNILAEALQPIELPAIGEEIIE